MEYSLKVIEAESKNAGMLFTGNTCKIVKQKSRKAESCENFKNLLENMIKQEIETGNESNQ